MATDIDLNGCLRTAPKASPCSSEGNSANRTTRQSRQGDRLFCFDNISRTCQTNSRKRSTNFLVNKTVTGRNYFYRLFKSRVSSLICHQAAIRSPDPRGCRDQGSNSICPISLSVRTAFLYRHVTRNALSLVGYCRSSDLRRPMRCLRRQRGNSVWMSVAKPLFETAGRASRC